MRKLLQYFIFILLFSFFNQNTSLAQSAPQLFKSGLKMYNKKEYNEALEVLLKSDSLAKKPSYMTRYYIGMCYLNTKYDKVKAIPYLEYSIQAEKFLIQKDVYLHLGDLYHYDYKFDQSILNYNKLINVSSKNDTLFKYAKRMIEINENAKLVVPNSLDVEIANLGEPVNTVHSEFSPLIAADESVVYFTFQNNPDLLKTNKGDTLKRICVSYKTPDKTWSKPEEIKFEKEIIGKKLDLAGLSPDGQQLFINIDNDIYVCEQAEDSYTYPVKLNGEVNTEYNEGRASLTADGSELYFSSDRPGGFGGTDIYKTTKLDDGSWGKAINLGDKINTAFDDKAPFIHPDKKTLYFSSKGHNSIGGFDIFQSYTFGGSWYKPRNIGYPINTTTDDLYFVLSASGHTGYFSSSQNNRFNTHDIYKVYLEKSIALTLLKGIITAGTPPKPIGAELKVIDKETNTRVKYIYHPNPKTGKYLMIFPPGKNYDMVIEAEGYMPKLINIHIPNQTYFYELFQEIHLISVKAGNEVIGEEVSVKNTFYDIFSSGDKDSTNIESKEPEKDYSSLLTLVEDIINATDSIAIEDMDSITEDLLDQGTNPDEVEIDKDFSDLFSMIEDAIETTDSNALAILEENTLYDEETTQRYFYAEETDKNNLEFVVIGGDTIYTTPSVQTKIKSTNTIKKEISYKKVKDIFKKKITTFVIEYDKHDAKVKSQYIEGLNQIAELITNNENLGLDIYAYSELKDEYKAEENYNMNLANSRARSIYKVFIDHEIQTNKLVLKPTNTDIAKLGEKIDTKRRVFIKLFEVLPEGFLDENKIVEFSEYDPSAFASLEKGAEIRLSKIYFDTGKAKLTEESATELNNVVKFLKDYPNVVIEVGGHTDNVGTDKTNNKLSLNRAQAVADHLTKNGIVSDRLIVKGYGKHNPVSYNTTEEGRQQNRRVSFTILKK